MRFVLVLAPLLILAACQDEAAQSAPEKKISYSREVRPLLIQNCVKCHGDFPLHDPSKWDLEHQHEEEITRPKLLAKWLAEGGKVDPHWAGEPLSNIGADSLDDLVELYPLRATPREVPQAMFGAPIAELLAGDLLPGASSDQVISTGYLRQGEDTPEWRIEKVAREFLGTRISCAKCHDHPSEDWSKTRYDGFAKLFTTPYDQFPNAQPPLLIMASESEKVKLAQLRKQLAEVASSAPVIEKDYLNWLARDEGFPTLPGLIAAYSFEGRDLQNAALASQVHLSGERLIAENGVHGEGLFFGDESRLILTELPFETELDRFTLSAWIKLEAEALSDTPIMTIGSRERGFEFRVIGGKLQARWSKFWPQLAATMTSKFPLLVPGRWSQVAITYDGSRSASGMQIYLNGHAVQMEMGAGKLIQSVIVDEVELEIAGEGLWFDELQIYDEALTPLGVRQIFDGRSLMEAYQAGEDLRKFYQKHFAEGEKTRRIRMREVLEEMISIEDQLPIYLVMESLQNEERGRLEFSQTLNQNLLARSLANEIWRRHFGAPLAHSLGFSDAMPSHPELLEWLASRLRESDFNVAQLGELIQKSEAWKREWPLLDNEPRECPRE